MLFRRRQHATDTELSAHLDGRLDGDSRERVARHVDSCAICQEALDGLRVVQTSLRSLPRTTAPRSFTLREADVWPAARAHPRRPLVRTTRVLSSVTAMATLAFLALLSVDVLGGPSSSSNLATTRSGAPAVPAAVEQKAAQSTGAGNYSAADQAATLTAAAADQHIRGPALGAVQATLTVVARDLAKGNVAVPPVVTPTAAGRVSRASGDDDTKLHVAEASLAAVALVSAGSVVVLARLRPRI